MEKHESQMKVAGKQNILIKFYSSSLIFWPSFASSFFNNCFAHVSYLHEAVNSN